MFTSAMCLKSESADYYMITSSTDNLQDLKEELSKNWLITTGEVRYMEAFESTVFEEYDVADLLEELQEGV